MAQKEKDPIVSSQGLLAEAVAVESGGELGEQDDVQARSYWALVWRRFKRDKVAIASGVFIIFLILFAFGGAPIARHYIGHGPDDIFTGTAAVDSVSLLPANPWTHIDNYYTNHRDILVLGGANRLGQDEFLRLLYGARVSLEVAVLSTLGVMVIGIILGTIAGYYRGWIDTAISRVIELTMVFPALLFIIALSATVGPQLNHITLGIFAPGVITLVIVFSLFGWFYPARIMRAQVLSLREKEFVEAARMVGSSDTRIMRSHIVPHLIAPIIVYSTLTVAQYILLEAGLSFLGLGINSAIPSWGNLLSTGPQYYLTQPWLMVWPGLAILLTTLAFNLLGDGLRDSFDPRATR